MTADAPAASLVGFSLGSKAAPKRTGDLTESIARAAAVSLPMPPPAPVGEPPPRAEEIVVYWERLRRGRPLPPLADLDRGLVARGWPDSLVVMFESDPEAMPRVSRLGAAEGEIEYTPMVTDWILARARDATRRAQRLDESRDFPLGGERPRYRLFVLPLASAGGEAVLCHLCRVA